MKDLRLKHYFCYVVHNSVLFSYSVPTNVLILFYSNNMIRVTLWGNRAFKFSYESVYDSQKQNPIVVLFVGCLPKEFKGLFQVLYIFLSFSFPVQTHGYMLFLNFVFFCSHFPFPIGISFLGSAATCHWYFNLVIREAAAYYERYVYLLCKE
jgi:hypothetical protein